MDNEYICGALRYDLRMPMSGEVEASMWGC